MILQQSPASFPKNECWQHSFFAHTLEDGGVRVLQRVSRHDGVDAVYYQDVHGHRLHVGPALSRIQGMATPLLSAGKS